jgi:hypothetical protein
MELMLATLALLTSLTGLATAYLNYKTAQKISLQEKQKKRKLWPWQRL